MTDQVLAGFVLAGSLMILLGLGVWVALSLFVVGIIGMLVFSTVDVGPVLAISTWSSVSSWSLASLPLFIWMGEILYRSRLSQDLFSGLAPWLDRLPGGLLHANILGCGIFAAVSGSSAATCITVGKMSLPELSKRNYNRGMMIGTLAGSGTLGLLIPPSIILIVYGVATEQSITRLFMAGVLPGIMLMLMFMGFVIVWSLLKGDDSHSPTTSMSISDKIRSSSGLIPVLLLIFAVIGSIYLGLASPTDAAAVGVLGALVLTWISGSLNWDMFKESLIGATVTSCMICLILGAAAFLTITMGFTGIPRTLAIWVGELGLSNYGLIAALTIFFLILGCFLDGISVVVLTTSVIVPMVQAAGIDLVWFGIFLVLVVEMAQLTPPVGFNLFVLQSVTGESILRVAWYAFPFFLLLLLATVLLVMFPEIATFLPSTLN